MPNLAALHPQVVHLVIGLLIVGVLFRLLSLTGKLSWTGPAATALILLGTGASVAAVKSGLDAHGPVERVPGARPIVVEHEELGEKTRNIFLVVSLLELATLALSGKGQRVLRLGSAALGLYGLTVLYETGEEGGELVYSFAGGVGIRTGDPEDVSRLLLAGQYHQAMLDRKNGKGAEAAALISDIARRFPNDTSVILMHIESTLRDRNDPAGALAALDTFQPPADNRRLVISAGMLRVDALAAAGQKDSARAVLTALMKAVPDNPRLKAKLDSLQ
ncbi:MAG: hypothetical protein ABS52_12420 [Gemmatimonadetes bacterium SCN 70-22]|mgnify:CR=1 FL=1|jgi:uncharacterized membrane protein|nr:MAG: hypothetical protein ABS52_12420 [Gemmatimonadetes bacterium SCN 70-22]